ncbi:MAG: exopolysaccharide biosynthesis protein [Elioraea sp.]|nr:exopolysaccharide biosynthesis protein [Elioraea sp.]
MSEPAAPSVAPRRGRDLVFVLERLAAHCAAAETVLVGRLLALLGRGAFGLAILVLALPIPLGNLPPAWAIILLGLALAVRDGALMLAGAALGVLALAWNVGVVVALAAAGKAALDGLEEGRLPFGAWAEGG